jgi:hypothetical protein
MREDVYSIIITQTQHSDKYRNVERLRWDKTALMSILTERINFNRKRNGLPALVDAYLAVFPETVGTSNSDNWLFERTLGRPRELIQFARYYTESVDEANPDAAKLKDAEAAYSSWKLDDLCAEYSNQYRDLIALFAYWKTKFFRHKYHLQRKELEEMMLQMAADVNIDAPWWLSIKENTDIEALLRVLYEIGFIGTSY